MRFIIPLILFCLTIQLSSCKSCQKTKKETNLLKVDSLENGSKKLYLLKNKKLEIVENNGYLSYTIQDNENTSVMKYVYAINQDQVAYDGGYREEILFEIPNGTFDKNYIDSELQEAKMLFGRYCFCRGKTGLYQVKLGKLHVKSSEDKTHFELDFKITEVPQETQKISY